MSRLRASLAQSDLDREVQSRLARAAREVRQALALCDKAKREGTRQEAYRARRVRRDLMNVLGSMESVRRATPLYDEEPPVRPPPVKVEKEAPKPQLAVQPPIILSATDVEAP